MSQRNIREKLLDGEKCAGIFQVLDHPGVSRIIAAADFDWVVLDAEHGHFTSSSLRNCLEVLQGRDISPLIRVPDNDTAIIKQVLDIGPQGILIPLVSDREECEAAVSASKYPPRGIRGIGPGRATDYGNNMKEYLENANDDILTAVQAETVGAVNNIEEISEVEGLDMIFIGPFDLSGSMDMPGQTDHQRVQEAVDKVIEVCRRKDVTLGMWCDDEEHAARMYEKGVQFLVCSTESMIFSRGLNESREKFAEF